MQPPKKYSLCAMRHVNGMKIESACNSILLLLYAHLTVPIRTSAYELKKGQTKVFFQLTVP